MNRSTRLTLGAAVTVAVAGTLPTTVALAQESAGLEEVIVTARKREIPLSPRTSATSLLSRA